MKRKNKKEIEEFAQNISDAISEQFVPQQQIEIVFLIHRKIFDNNVKRLVIEEVQSVLKHNYLQMSKTLSIV